MEGMPIAASGKISTFSKDDGGSREDVGLFSNIKENIWS
jgi:hypothetical protein